MRNLTVFLLLQEIQEGWDVCKKGETHRKCAIKDRGVEQGRAVCQTQHCQLVALCACPHHPTPLLEHLPDLLWWLSVRTSSQDTLHCQPNHLPQTRHRPRITALKQTSLTTWFYFQRLKLLINLLGASLSGFALARLWLLSGLRNIQAGPVLCLAMLWQATSSSGYCQTSTSMNEHLASQTMTEQALSFTHTSSTPQKTGRNFGVPHINRGFYHLFSLPLLPSCGKFAQISEERMQTSC